MTMRNIKNFSTFVESFNITKDELSTLGDFVDNLDYNDDRKIAYVDFKGIKNIPIHISDTSDNTNEVDVEVEVETENKKYKF